MGLLDKFGVRGSTATDPVCDMQVDTRNPPGGSSTYKGDTFYFCAPGCKRAFDGDPEKYLAKLGHGGAGEHPE